MDRSRVFDVRQAAIDLLGDIDCDSSSHVCVARYFEHALWGFNVVGLVSPTLLNDLLENEDVLVVEEVCVIESSLCTMLVVWLLTLGCAESSGRGVRGPDHGLMGA